MVPLILHCLTFPGGFNVLWNLIESEFSNEDWRIRMDATEKVSILIQELDSHILAGSFSGAANDKLNSMTLIGSIGGASLFGRPSQTTKSRFGKSKLGVGQNRQTSANLANFEDVSSGHSGANHVCNRNPCIQTTLAYAFCCLIGSADDINCIIAQYASSQLALLNNVALNVNKIYFKFNKI